MLALFFEIDFVYFCWEIRLIRKDLRKCPETIYVHIRKALNRSIKELQKNLFWQGCLKLNGLQYYWSIQTMFLIRMLDIFLWKHGDKNLPNKDNNNNFMESNLQHHKIKRKTNTNNFVKVSFCVNFYYETLNASSCVNLLSSTLCSVTVLVAGPF